MLTVLEVDKSLSTQILETIQNDGKLYKNLVLDFIQLTINEDPYTLCKHFFYINIDESDPKIDLDLKGFTQIKKICFNKKKNLIWVYGLCKQDYYMYKTKQNQTQTWKNTKKSSDTTHWILILIGTPVCLAGSLSQPIISGLGMIPSNFTFY